MIKISSHSARVNSDGPFGDRFWYWNGSSGRRYIHSVFRLKDCPPCPGAIYLAIRRDGAGQREVCAIGRFPQAFDGLGGCLPSQLVKQHGVNEVHVHLLAETDSEVETALADLSAALLPAPAEETQDEPSPHGLQKLLPAFAAYFKLRPERSSRAACSTPRIQDA